MRLTRAKAAAQAEAEADTADVHTDDQIGTTDNATNEKTSRMPLGEIGPNATEVETKLDPDLAPVKPASKKKAGRSKPAKADQNIIRDENENLEVNEGTSDRVQPLSSDIRDEKEAEPQPPFTTHTSPDEAAQEEQGASGTQHVTSFSDVETVIQEMTLLPEDDLIPLPTNPPSTEAVTGLLSHKIELEGESPTLEPEELSLPPQRTPARKLQAKELSSLRSTSNKENVQPQEQPHGDIGHATLRPLDSVASSTHQGVSANITTTLDQDFVPIERQILDKIDTPIDEPVPAEQEAQVPPSAVIAESAMAKKPAVRTSAKPSKARPSSVIVGKVAPRAGSLQNRAPATTKSASAEKTPVNVPHSKPRPVSVSFPTPPAPPKSSKPPTKSTFQLPGEAVAAKLKAAREERRKKEEAESEKRPAFKARPAPKSKEGPPALVRQTASSRARESLVLGKPLSENARPIASGGLGRASSVRESMVRGKVPPTGTKRISTVPPAGRAHAAPITEKPPTSNIVVQKRASTALANTTSKTRAPSTTSDSQASASAAAGTKKGKEVFQRAATEKQALEKQKHEKEEAARKARAEAAERGRLASREWAEKMRLKALKAKEGKQNTAVPVTTTSAAAV